MPALWAFPIKLKKPMGATKHIDFILKHDVEIPDKGISIDDNFSIVGKDINFSYNSSSSVLKNINFEAYQDKSLRLLAHQVLVKQYSFL